MFVCFLYFVGDVGSSFIFEVWALGFEMRRARGRCCGAWRAVWVIWGICYCAWTGGDRASRTRVCDGKMWCAQCLLVSLHDDLLLPYKCAFVRHICDYVDEPTSIILIVGLHQPWFRLFMIFFSKVLRRPGDCAGGFGPRFWEFGSVISGHKTTKCTRHYSIFL